MYCEFPAEFPPPPWAGAVAVAARPSPVTARNTTTVRVSKRIPRYSISAARLYAARDENPLAMVRPERSPEPAKPGQRACTPR